MNQIISRIWMLVFMFCIYGKLWKTMILPLTISLTRRYFCVCDIYGGICLKERIFFMKLLQS